MKVQSAVIRLVLRTNKTLANGMHPIMLRVSFGYMKERSTGYCCSASDWDKKAELVKAGFPHAVEINKIITDFKNKIIARRFQFELMGKKYTPEMLLDDNRLEFSAQSHVYKDIMERMISEKQLDKSTIAHYNYSYNRLAVFLGTEHFLVNDLTEHRMLRFIKGMLEEVSEGTVHTTCAKIAAVCNYAVSLGLLPAEDYCFNKLKYAKLAKKANRKAYVDKDNMLRIRDYYLRLMTTGDEEHWTFRPGAEKRLLNRHSLEFAVCFWLAMFKLNGSAPIDVALLKEENLEIRHFTDANGHSDRYYCFNFKRAKTGIDVRPRIVCDRLARAIFEPFLQTCHLRDGYIFPIIQNNKHSLRHQPTYEGQKRAVQHIAHATSEKMKQVCGEINSVTEDYNRRTGQHLPLIDVASLSCYNMRHSFAMAYLSSPGANVNALASLMARSPNSIGVYITQLNKDHDLIESVARIGI